MTAPTWARRQVERSATSRVIVMKYWSQLGRSGLRCRFGLSVGLSANSFPSIDSIKRHSDFYVAQLPQHLIVMRRVVDYFLTVTIFVRRHRRLRLHKRERHRAEGDDEQRDGSPRGDSAARIQGSVAIYSRGMPQSEREHQHCP